MVLDKILYFPAISIPRSTWTNRALLYWDEIGSIVPLDYIDKPDSLEPFMRDLVSAELVTQIFPGQYTYNIPYFKEAFLGYIQSNPIIQDFVQKRRRPTNYVRIHLEKMRGLEDNLMDMGLATRGSSHNFYNVEAYTGYSFMTYLASTLSSVIDFQPATDKSQYLSNLAANPFLPESTSELRDQLRIKVLENILPAPAEITNINQLVKFKEKFGDELIRFRNEIETFLMSLETVPETQVNERITRFIQTKRDEMNYISSKMKEHKWRFLDYVTLMSVASAVIPLSTATEITGTLAAVPGLLAAIGSALGGHQIEQIRRHPLAYAILADRYL